MCNTKIFSVGYGNRNLKTFIEILKENEIQVVVDVRTNPISRFRPEYNKRVFEISLAENGIQYVHRSELGGKPSNQEFYNNNGKLDYDKLRKSIPYLQGLDYVEAGLSFGCRMVLLCAEQDYHDCHRYHLIGVDLAKRGWQVIHIGKAGELEPHNLGLL